MGRNVRDGLFTLVTLAAATGIALLLKWVGNVREVNLIFILAVYLIAMQTEGYGWGLVASAGGVIGSNYFVTYPYMAFNFLLAGYPVTFISMFLVSALTSMLATRGKEQAALARIAEVEKTRADLLRSVSHDLRTPLTSVIGSSSMLLQSWDKLADADRRSLVTDIKDDAEWLLNMAENVLSATRMEGKAALFTEAQPVEEIVYQAVARCRSRLSGSDIVIKAPDSLVIVWADAALIERVLINLIENAYKYAAPPITVEIEPPLGGMAAISVADRGRGIPADQQSTIFMRGRQRPPDSSRGLGIGLSLCRAIVRAHGGEITCQNAEGGGAIFRFTLPAEEEEV
ncbi:MAG TPA: ATP-binding protein [Terriglobales bacterium]|nr:ATP-binding protein [Terriglobales bacterium]